tara:strand:- start:53 stop:313 length:261 start_codon:yes stop_codon:yes gene_type:complete
MVKIIVVAWFTFVLVVMSVAPITLTVTWIKSLLNNDKPLKPKNIFLIIMVIGFSLIFTYFMVFGVAIQFWIPIFPWMEKFAIPLNL